MKISKKEMEAIYNILTLQTEDEKFFGLCDFFFSSRKTKKARKNLFQAFWSYFENTPEEDEIAESWFCIADTVYNYVIL